MSVSLPRVAILSIDLARQEITVECRAGSLWLTKTGDRRDYVLNQGEKCLLSGSGKVVIEAVYKAFLEVCSKSALPCS